MTPLPSHFSTLTPQDARILLGTGLRMLPKLLRPDQMEPPPSLPAPDWEAAARRLAARGEWAP